MSASRKRDSSVRKKGGTGASYQRTAIFLLTKSLLAFLILASASRQPITTQRSREGSSETIADFQALAVEDASHRTRASADAHNRFSAIFAQSISSFRGLRLASAAER